MSNPQGRPLNSGSGTTRRVGRPPSSSASGSGNGNATGTTTSMINRATPSGLPPSRPLQRPTQSFISSSTSSQASTIRPVRPPGPRLVFRPRQPSRVTIKENPDGPSRSASPASGNGGTPPISADMSLNGHSRLGPRRYNGSGTGNRPSRPPGNPVMVASGPFAQGSGAASRSDHSRSGKMMGGVGTARHGLLANLSMEGLDSKEGLAASSSSARLNYREPDKNAKKEKEDYSDPEEGGIEIIDLEDVDQLDELAPRSLPRMKKEVKGGRKRSESEQARSQNPHGGNTTAEATCSRENSTPLLNGGKDADSREADALDLSANEEEEVMDDLLDDFVTRQDGFEDDVQQPEDRLYLFQFPPLFPVFEAPPKKEKVENESSNTKAGSKPRRSVAFADDTVGGGGAAGVSPRDSPALPGAKVKNEEPIDVDQEQKHSVIDERKEREGRIGSLDVYRDGRVQFNFGNGLVMDVTGGSQSSFLQQIMIIDPLHQKATTIGELDRKFVVSPEISSMLDDATLAESEANLMTDPEGMEKVSVN